MRIESYSFPSIPGAELLGQRFVGAIVRILRFTRNEPALRRVNLVVLRDAKQLKVLHAQLVGGIIPSFFRSESVMMIGGSGEAVMLPAIESTSSLVDRSLRIDFGSSPLVRIATAFYRKCLLIHLHPFADGNGRTLRAVWSLELSVAMGARLGRGFVSGFWDDPKFRDLLLTAYAGFRANDHEAMALLAAEAYVRMGLGLQRVHS